MEGKKLACMNEQEEMALYERGVRVFGLDGVRIRASSACLHAAAALDAPISACYETEADKSRCRRAVAQAYAALNMLEVALGGVADEELESLRDLDARVKIMEEIAQKKEAGE